MSLIKDTVGPRYSFEYLASSQCDLYIIETTRTNAERWTFLSIWNFWNASSSLGLVNYVTRQMRFQCLLHRPPLNAVALAHFRSWVIVTQTIPYHLSLDEFTSVRGCWTLFCFPVNLSHVSNFSYLILCLRDKNAHCQYKLILRSPRKLTAKNTYHSSIFRSADIHCRR